MARKPRQPARPQPAIDSISEPSSDLAAVPPLVLGMRARILGAVDAGDIEALRPALEWNETPPVFARGQPPVTFATAIEFLKARSFDGKGKEILGLLAAIFEQPYARVRRSPTETWVWPAFAARQRPDISGEERLAMYRCSRFSNILLTNDIGLPLIERVGIGADGTWHYFYAG